MTTRTHTESVNRKVNASGAAAQEDSRWGEALLAVWTTAGLALPERWHGEKAAVKCPLHDDRNASAVLLKDRGVYHCSCCGSFSAKKLAAALNIPWPLQPGAVAVRPVRVAKKRESPPAFSPADAARVWAACLERVRDDNAIDEDASVYRFLRQRHLAEAWEERPHIFGILPPGDDDRIPPSIRRWGWTGHRLVCPLYGTREKRTGQLVNIQARHVGIPHLPKGARLKLFPTGSTASGTAFANGPAIEMLRGGRRGERVVITEGLTDFLAHAIADDGCVLGIPGTGMASSAIGAWVRGRMVVLFLDADEAGLKATREAARRILDFGGRVRRGVPS